MRNLTFIFLYLAEGIFGNALRNQTIVIYTIDCMVYNSNIKGNISAKYTSLGGKLQGNVNSDKIKIKKTAEIEGVLNQKTLAIEEGANLKIKTETYK